jgi:hypothetical protein
MGLVWCGCERAVILKDLVRFPTLSRRHFPSSEEREFDREFSASFLSPEVIHQRRVPAKLLFVDLIADRLIG